VSDPEPYQLQEKRQIKERVKELGCLYHISRLISRRDATLFEILDEVVQVIPSAWQFPELAGARIEVDGHSHCSAGFVASHWLQQCVLIAGGRTVGTLTVIYSEECPEQDEGPFLFEERNLLNTIAQQLGEVIERIKAEEQVRIYQNKMRALAAELAVSEQRERRTIAEGLHDRIGQSMAMLNLRLGAAFQMLPDGESRDILSYARGLVGEIISDIRSLTFELCPPILYELGFGAAVSWLVEQTRQRYGLEASLRENGNQVNLVEEVLVTLFQGVREVLANVAKHAHARRVEVEVCWQSDELRTVVEDDGVGFNTEEVRKCRMKEGGFGLFNLQERLEYLGGRLDIFSERGSGTRVIMVAPLHSLNLKR